MKVSKLKPALEAALFMSSESLSLQDLAKLTGRGEEEIRKALIEMKTELENEEKGVHILETNAGYVLKVKPEFTNMVRTLSPYQDLSRGLLRVLAMVAYKQ